MNEYPNGVIWKFRLPSPGSTETISVREAWNITHVQSGYMWVWLEPDAPEESVTITTIGTGHPVPVEGFVVGTWIDGPFVWHAIQMEAL